MKTLRFAIAVVVAAAACQVASAMEGPPAQVPAAAPEPQQEIIIEATRAYLTKLGKEFVEDEHRLYARYNQLNKKREYDVLCDTFAHTETHFVHTDCSPRYVFEAKAREGGDFSRYFQTISPEGVANASPPLAADPAITAHRDDFRKNMMEVVRNNPELQKALAEHAALWKQYEDTFYKLNGRPLLNAKPPAPKPNDEARK